MNENIVCADTNNVTNHGALQGGKERYRTPGKLTLELVLANQNKLLCLWTIQLTKWAGKVPYLLLLKCSMDQLKRNQFARTELLMDIIKKIRSSQRIFFKMFYSGISLVLQVKANKSGSLQAASCFPVTSFCFFCFFVST